MKSIVVPVNFTECSANAVHYAADMALAIEADIHLIHVLQVPVSPAEIPMPDYVFESLESNAKELLRSLSQEITDRTKGQVSVTTEMEIGNVEYHMEEICKRRKPFLVVMGASGDSMERVWAGSNTVHAVRHLPYPILVVPAKQSFHAVRKVVLACDTEDVASAIPVSLAFLKDLRDLFAAKFDVVTIVKAQEKRRPSDFLVSPEARDTALSDTWPEIHFIRTDDVEEGIQQYLDQHPVDWLMVFPKKHALLSFHKSHSKQIVMHCPVPVLSVHEAKK